MTSTLPDFVPSPPAAPSTVEANALVALFPGAHPAAPAPTLPPEFASMMGLTFPARATLPVAPETPVALVTGASTSTRLKAAPSLAAPSLITVNPARSISVAPIITSLDQVPMLAPEVEPADPAQPREITREMLEEAAAFVNALLQSLLPGVPPPELSAVAYQRSLTASGDGAGDPAAMPAAAVLVMPKNNSTAAKPASGPHLFTLAPDGAIELKLELAQFQPTVLNPKLAAAASLEISAALQRNGETALRFAASATLPGADRGSPEPTPPLGRENIAGIYLTKKFSPESSTQGAERNFVFTGDKQVKPASSLAGITVADVETTMPVAPLEEARPIRNSESFAALPPRVDFPVVVPLAERNTVPAAAAVEQNLAQRAVETVTNLADTQFTASMQKSGSVHLHLRFGGEDLSVRVEIKDGVVQTDFRTDSIELRSALAREWQVVAAQSPEQMRRYLEPVFSPNPSPAAGTEETPALSSRQQQGQQDLPSRQARESWPESASTFSRRSQLSDAFIPEPAVTRGPTYLPTSLRLSALA